MWNSFNYNPFHLLISKAIISGVACSPNINVYTTKYENKFKKLGNQTCPYDSVDIHPKLGNVVFLIVVLNDYTEITKSKLFQHRNNFNLQSTHFMFDWVWVVGVLFFF